MSDVKTLNNPPSPTILAIDYGQKYIGLALSQGGLAEPLIVFDNDQNIFKNLQKTCSLHQVSSIVVGISEGEMAQQTKQFTAKLKQVVKLPLVFQDETLSSYSASQKLRHAKKSKRSQRQDAFQATLMLQDYLDAQTDHNKKKGKW